MADYIDRENYCKSICRCSRDKCDKDKCPIWAAPAADVREVVRGKWVYDENATDWGIGGYVCSECKNKNNNLPCNRVKSVRMFSGAKFCPNCGAEMRGEGNV